MTPELAISSIGQPHELHANRVVAGMMRFLSDKQASVWAAVRSITSDPHVRDGNPKAQAGLVSKIKAAGASHVNLVPGKRGRYLITAQNLLGWDRNTHDCIEVGDAIPDKPWLAIGYLSIEGVGHGLIKSTLSITSVVSHHALSRTCQRWKVRTVPELVRVVETIEAAVRRCADETIGDRGPEAWQQKIPPQGLRYPVNSSATMVLQWYAERGIPVVATIMDRTA
jgi:hypothetical protein